MKIAKFFIFCFDKYFTNIISNSYILQIKSLNGYKETYDNIFDISEKNM